MDANSSVLVKDYPSTFTLSEVFKRFRSKFIGKRFRYNREDFESDIKYKIIQSLTPDEVFKMFEERTKERFERERLELVPDSSKFTNDTGHYPVTFTTAELYALAKAKSVILRFESRYET